MIKMNVTYTCLLLLTYICFSRGDDPIQSVVCDERGTLSATITDDYSQWTLPITVNCGLQHDISINRAINTFNISGCAVGTSVVLVFTKTNTVTGVDGSVALTPTKEIKTVTLTCIAITKDVTKDVELSRLSFIGTVADDAVTKNATETIDMIMELREASGSNNTVTSMSLHGTYSLWIAGAGSHATQVTKCTASTAANGNEGVTIFPSDTPKVLEPFTSDTTQSKDINGKKVNQISTLTGFRLVGSKTVFLKCTINVCAQACPTLTTSPAGSQPQNQIPTTINTPNKKRKGGKHPSTVHYATLKLNVRDTLLGTSTNGATDTFQVGRKLVKFIVLITTIGFIY